MQDGIFIGATATKYMRNAMLVSVLFFYFPVFVLAESWFGIHGMWAATLGLYAMRGLTLGWPLMRLYEQGGAKSAR